MYKGKKDKLNPQDAWNNCISEASSRSASAPISVRQYIEKLGSQSNVPRNANKFRNFVKNSFRLQNDKLIDEMWSFLEKFKVVVIPVQLNEKVDEPPLDMETRATSTTAESSDQHSELEAARLERKKAKKEKKKRDREAARTSDSGCAASENDDTDKVEKDKRKKKKERRNISSE